MRGARRRRRWTAGRRSPGALSPARARGRVRGAESVTRPPELTRSARWNRMHQAQKALYRDREIADMGAHCARCYRYSLERKPLSGERPCLWSASLSGERPRLWSVSLSGESAPPPAEKASRSRIIPARLDTTKGCRSSSLCTANGAERRGSVLRARHSGYFDDSPFSGVVKGQWAQFGINPRSSGVHAVARSGHD